MMQFFQQQMLQSLGGFALGGIDAGLRQDARGIDAGLRQQGAETGDFCFESGLLETCGVAFHARTAW